MTACKERVRVQIKVKTKDAGPKKTISSTIAPAQR